MWAFVFSTAFGIQLFGFVLSTILQSELFYDVLGSITYISVAWGCLYISSDPIHVVTTVAVCLVTVWAARLGTFLFIRVIQTGGDSRFEEIRTDKIKFFVAWMMQGVWVVATLVPLVLLLQQRNSLADPPIQQQFALGIALWAIGWILETISDAQKFAFKCNRDNAGQYITSGMFAFCKYPNYLGEIMLWTGMYLLCTSVASTTSTYLYSLISPLFITFLLCFVSGIPIQERQARQRWPQAWADDPRPKLIPHVY